VIISDYGCNNTSNEFNLDCNSVAVPKPSVSWSGTQFTSSSGYAGYQWYLNGNAIAGANASSFTPIQTGIYKVTVTGSLNCTNTSNEFNFDCNTAVPKPSVSWSGTLLTSSPAGYAGYQWYLNGNAIASANASSFTPVQTGIYKVTVTGSFNCSNTSNEFTFDCNLVGPSKPILDWNGTQFSSASGYVSYQWYKDDVAIAGATSSTYTPGAGQFGMYKVAVTDNYNCSRTSDAKPYQFTAVNDITIGDAMLRYYPNPAHTVLNIDVPLISTKKMLAILYDLNGRKAVQQVLKRGQNQLQVRQLSSGLYQLKIQYGLEKIALKVVVIR
jgi:hypothetical protein